MIKLKRDDDQKKGSPAWMTTYADIMTLVLCLFVLLYAFSILDMKRFESVAQSINIAIQGNAGNVKSNKGNIFKKDTDVLDRTKKDGLPQKIGLTVGEVAQMRATQEEIRNHISNQPYGASVDLNITERGLVISFLGQVLFESGKADIRQGIIPILDKIAAILKNKENSIRVEGFTDDVPISSGKYPSNWELSTARATAVLRHLVSMHGIDPNRLSAAGYGEYKPRKPNIDAGNRALNRRVDIVILYPSLEIREPK